VLVESKLPSGRFVTDFGDGCVDFPIGNRQFVNADLVGNLLLEEIGVQPPRANMVA
jgi:hypothetical protein